MATATKGRYRLEYSRARVFFPRIGAGGVLDGPGVRPAAVADVEVEAVKAGRSRSLVQAACGYAWTDNDTLTKLD